jgi:3-dehydroquinate dehydratase-2
VPCGKILILNGPNLNLLGLREPEIYGRETLADLERRCRDRAAALGAPLDFRQSNGEGQLIDWIHGARQDSAGIVINAGAYSHTSVAIMDALAGIMLPVIEVHLSNIHRREEFRHHSYVSRVARGVIVGLGCHGYELAIEALCQLLAADQTVPGS